MNNKTCLNKHALSFSQGSIRNYPSCNGCGQLKLPTSYCCYTCNYDLCANCFGKINTNFNQGNIPSSNYGQNTNYVPNSNFNQGFIPNSTFNQGGYVPNTNYIPNTNSTFNQGGYVPNTNYVPNSNSTFNQGGFVPNTNYVVPNSNCSFNQGGFVPNTNYVPNSNCSFNQGGYVPNTNYVPNSNCSFNQGGYVPNTNYVPSCSPTIQTNAILYKQCPAYHYLSLCDFNTRPYPRCDVCKQVNLMNSWTCFSCDYDMCLNCYDYNNQRPTNKVKVCNMRHLLVYTDCYQRPNVRCDVCGTTNISNQYTCWICNFDECLNCYEGRTKVNCNIF